MTRYIKEENGEVVEAPKVRTTETTQTIGYNKPGNEAQLLEDGYIRYDGILPLKHLTIVDGEVVEQELPEPPQLPVELSKLKIVDLLISLDLVDGVMASINADPIVKLRWDVAVTLAPDDPMVVSMFEQLAPMMEQVGLKTEDVIERCKV